MFYCTGQPRTSFFPIGLVKTESDFIIRSVETDLRRWTLVAAVISVDAYPFFDFLRPELSPWGYRSRCFIFPRSLGVICYDRWVLSEGQKITSRIGVLWTHSLAFSFWLVFNSVNYAHIMKRTYDLYDFKSRIRDCLTVGSL